MTEQQFNALFKLMMVCIKHNDNAVLMQAAIDDARKVLVAQPKQRLPKHLTQEM